MSTQPTTATITQALAALHTAHPDAPVTRWEVYPPAETTEGEAHLYADLLATPSDMADAVTTWARLLDAEVHVTHDTSESRLTITVTLPGGVHLAISELVPTDTLPETLRTVAVPAPALF